MRFAILNPADKVLDHLDSEKDYELFADEFHRYLDGNAFLFSFTSYHSQYLEVGNHISFRYEGREYYSTIITVKSRDFGARDVTCLGLSLELTNEETGEYKADKAYSFKEYLDKFVWWDKCLELGLNEVSSKKIKCEWTGTETILSRLFSLATKFDAELEFVTELNKDGSLKRMVLNVHRAYNGDRHSGMGRDRRDEIVRLDELKDSALVKGIEREADISDIYTLIEPHGSTPEGQDNPINISSLNGRTVKDSKGRIEYRVENGRIRAVQARDRFPSTLVLGDKGGYILKEWSYETENVETLYSQALARLKKDCQPKMTYSIDGFVEGNIGDVVTIEDRNFEPVLYLQCRIIEQVISFTDRTKNKTTFSNFVERESKISPQIQALVIKEIEETKSYACYIVSDNGILLKKAGDTTTLTGVVMDKGNDVTDSFKYNWYKNGVWISHNKSWTVGFNDLSAVTVYKFEALKDSKVRAQCEITLATVKDGETGQDGRSPILHVRYSNDGGLTFTANNGKTAGDWIGQYVDYTAADSTNVADYSWSKIKGEEGQGIAGQKTNFYLSTSNTELKDGSWSDSYESVPVGKYLWRRTEYTLVNPAGTRYSTPYCDMSWFEYMQDQKSNLMTELTNLESKLTASFETGQANLTSTLTADFQDELGNNIATLRSEVEQLYNQLTLKFEGVEADLSDADAEHAAQLQEIMTWFQFSSDGLSIGKANDPMALKLINDKITFMRSGYDVAWFSNSELHISHAVLENQLKIGHYVIIANTDGSVDVKLGVSE